MPPKTVVILPARWGSTRFPGKPLHAIAGKPLIQHVWERCQEARGIEAVIVATDDMRIAEAAFAFGAEVALTSEKHRSGTDRVAEVAARLRGVRHVINVQGDEPLIDPALISQLAKTLKKDRDLGMVTAASALRGEEELANPNVVKVVVDRDGNALYFSRSPIPFVRDAANVQRSKARRSRLNTQSSTPFLRHQGIYGFSRKFLLEFVQWRPGALEQLEQLEQLRALENGARIRVLITKHTSVGIDAPEDVPQVEARLSTLHPQLSTLS